MLKNEDINRLLTDLLGIYGYDFTYYSKESLSRRLNKIYNREGFKSFEEFRNKILLDADYIEHLVNRITVNTTEMFRDTNFFKDLREHVLPIIANRPQIKIWHAGCSSGEEVYSMAILLHECGLLHKSTLFASDINLRSLEKARLGVFPLSLLQLYEHKYIAAGGTGNFSEYYNVCLPGGKMDAMFREKIVFTHHNLATDAYFGKFDVIVCRNVVIYFEKKLQYKAFRLFNLSLSPGSFLALGEKETIRFSPIEDKYTQLGTERIWKKIN